jgi:glutaredoxin 3
MNLPVADLSTTTQPSAAPSAVVMYTTTICAYCIRAKMLLKKREIPYEEINVGSDADKRSWLVQATGRKTVPQIFIHGQSIGGFEELAAMDRAGTLMPMISGRG